MKEISFKYIKDWRITKKFKELYYNEVSMVGYLSKKCLLIDHTEGYDSKNDKYDQVYIALVEKECTGKYRVSHRTKNIRFDLSRKLVEKFSRILGRYNFRFGPNQLVIYIGSSLKILLESNGYVDYEGPIRVYGEFGPINTTKTNIGKIWKAEILNNEGGIIETIGNIK